MESDTILGAETNLKNSDTPASYDISSSQYHFHHRLLNDEKQRIGRGLIVYSKNKIEKCDTFIYRNGIAVLEIMAVKVIAIEFELIIEPPTECMFNL